MLLAPALPALRLLVRPQRRRDQGGGAAARPRGRGRLRRRVPAPPGPLSRAARPGAPPGWPRPSGGWRRRDPALADGPDQPLPADRRADPGAAPSRVRPVVRHGRDRRLAPPLPGRRPSSTGTCTSRARPGTTACASRRSRSATRASARRRPAGSSRPRRILPEARVLERDPAAEPPRSSPAGERASSVELFPEEEAASATRSRSAAASSSPPRACAREALAQLGHAAAADPDRRPRRAALAGRDRGQHHPLRRLPGLRGRAGERAAHDRGRRRGRRAASGRPARRHRPARGAALDRAPRPQDPGVSWDRLLFSIKESVYKAWFPLARSWLGFEDASVAIDRARGTFSASLLVPGPTVGGRKLDGFTGRWLAADGLLLSAIAVPAS